MARMRNYLHRMNRHMKREAVRWGQTVLWYEFNPATVADAADLDLYDEGGVQTGGGIPARWKRPRRVQVQLARLDEGAEQYNEDGQYTVDRLTLIVNRLQLHGAGISRPVDRGAHINDRVEYDGRLFKVTHFDTRATLADDKLTVTVTAVEVKADERQTEDPYWHEGLTVAVAPLTWAQATGTWESYDIPWSSI